MGKNSLHSTHLWCLIALSIVIFLSRLPSYNEPYERDISNYAVMAHEMLQGQLLYTDLFDQKPPAIFMTYALAELLWGYGSMAIYLLGVMMAIITLIGVYLAAKHLSQSQTLGLWAALFWTLVQSTLGVQANQPNIEVFMNGCLVWAFYLLVSDSGHSQRFIRPVTVGALLTLGSLYKPLLAFPSVIWVLLNGIFPAGGRAPYRRGVQQGLVMASMACIGWGLAVHYFWIHNRLGDFLDIFSFNRYYAGDILQNIKNGFKPANLLPEFTYKIGPLFFLPLVVLYRWLIKRQKWERSALLLLGYLLSVPLMIMSTGKFYPHYYQLWLPCLCLWSALFLMEISKTKRINMSWVGTLIALGLFVLQAPDFFLSAKEWSRQKYGDIFIDVKESSKLIPKLLQPEERFYVWTDSPGFYFYTQKSPLRGSFYLEHFIDGPLASKLTLKTLGDFKKYKPELVVTTVFWPWGGRHGLSKYISRHYISLPKSHQPHAFQFYYLKGGRLEKRLSRDAKGAIGR